MSDRQRSPPPPPRQEQDRFSRANFGAPPNRHEPSREPLRERPPIPERGVAMSGTAPGLDERLERPPMREWDRDRENDRGGRASSHWHESDRPKRRRSPSISYPSQRTRRYSPEPPYPPFQPQSQLGVEPLDPALIPHQLTFKEFAGWFRVAHPATAKADEEDFRRYKAEIEEGIVDPESAKERVGLGKRYERYRKEYTSRQLYTLYLTHRNSPWFTEKYSPSAEDTAERKRVNVQGRTRTVEQYIQELQAGKHDDVSYDQASAHAKPDSEPNRYAKYEDAETRQRAKDEEDKLELPPTPNQIFVRSVPPTLRRRDLEHLFRQIEGFEYLALSEPSVKRSFHRVAWAQYAEGTDVESVAQKLDDAKIDNFTFHMGVNTSPTIGRIRYTPTMAGSLARLLKDGEKAKALSLKLESELIPASPAAAEGAEGVDVQMKEGDAADGGAEAEKGGLKVAGSVVVLEVIQRVLDKEGLGSEEGMNHEQKIKRAKITLDHWISYLRHGLSTCYYCVAPHPFPEELLRRCVGHVRAVDPSAGPAKADSGDVAMTDDTEVPVKVEMDDKSEVPPPQNGERERGRGRVSNDEKWEENIDGKLAPLLSEVDVVEYGGRDIEEETKKLTEPMIKQESANKFRCRECSKLFKAEEFVSKHVVVKHGEVIAGKLDDLATFNNFVLDPQHLLPNQQILGAIDDELPPSTLIPPAAGFGSNIAITAAAAAAAAAASSGAAALSTPQGQQQMMAMMLQMQQAMMGQMGNGGAGMGMGMAGQGYGGGGGGRGRRESMSSRNGQGRGRETLPPAPGPPAMEDPRAKKGRVSYKDLDGAGGGGDDGGLPY